MKRWWQLLIVFLLGIILSFKFNPSFAARYCEDASCNSNSVSSIQTVPSQLVEQAREFYQIGEYRKSLKLLQQTQKTYTSQQKYLQQTQVFSLIAQTYLQMGNWQLAEENIAAGFDSIALVASSKPKMQVLGQIWNVKGHLELAQGNNSQALADWEQAQELYSRANDMLGVAGSLLDCAKVLETMGFYSRSCDRILEALGHRDYDCLNLTSSQIKTITDEVAKDTKTWQIQALNQLSNILLLKGKRLQADTILQTNREISSRLKNLSPAIEAQIILSLANVNKAIAFQAKEIQDNSTFVSRSQRAIEYYQQLDRKQLPEQIAFEYRLPAQLNLLSLEIATQQWSKAQSLVAFIQLYPNTAINRRNLDSEIKFALELERLKQNKIAIKYSWQDIADIYLMTIAEAANKGDLRIQSYGLGYLGMLQTKHQALQTQTTPQQSISQALSLAKQINTPEIIYRWQWQLGRIYAEQKQRKFAIASYKASLITLASLRNDLSSLAKEIQFDFHQQIEPIYKEYVDLLLTGSVSNRDLATAIDTIESLQVAELDNYFQDACTISNHRNIAQIDKDAAAIYTLTLPDRLEIIMAVNSATVSPAAASVTPTFRHHTVPISQTELEKLVAQLRLNITEPDRAIEVQKLATKLYKLLLEPLEPDLAQIQPKNLVFIVDGILQTVPMSVLYDGEKYLLEKYAIAYTPGLRTIDFQDAAAKKSFLAGGITKELQIEEQEFSALKNVKTELGSFSNTDSQILLDRDFTTKNFSDRINNTSASYIHIATHGRFSSNPDRTFLLMWRELLTIKKFGELLQARQQKTNIPIDLLVLSACNTASGDRNAALGLAGVAVRSGAKTTLATLWQVNDESTAALMEIFYRHLKNHHKAEALRLAQLELWQRSDRDWKVPSFWSAYITIGNWQ